MRRGEAAFPVALLNEDSVGSLSRQLVLVDIRQAGSADDFDGVWTRDCVLWVAVEGALLLQGSGFKFLLLLDLVSASFACYRRLEVAFIVALLFGAIAAGVIDSSR